MVDKRAFDALGGRFAPPVGDEQVCISIPAALIPHLLGALEPLRWPDVWDGDGEQVNRVTGEIENLLSRLITRSRCDIADCPDCPDCEAAQAGLGGAVILESEDMGQVVTDLQIVNGQIRVFFGPCCWKDLGTIADIEAGEAEGVTPPWDEVYPDGPVYSACSKATAIVDEVYRLVEVAFGQTNDAPWNWVGHIESDFGMNLDDTHVVELMGAVMFGYLTTNMSFGDTNDTTQRQKIKSRVFALLADDSAGVPTSDVFEAIKNAFGYEMTFEDYAGIYARALDSIGRADLDSIAKLGAIADPAADCSEPEVFSPTGQLYWVGNVVNIAGESGTIQVLDLSADGLKLSVRWSGTGLAFTGKRAYFPLVCVSAVSTVDIKLTGEPPYGSWDTDYPPINWSLVGNRVMYPPGSTAGTTLTLVELGADYRIVRASYGTPAIVGSFGGYGSDILSAPGKDYAGVPFEFEWQMEILSVT